MCGGWLKDNFCLQPFIGFTSVRWYTKILPSNHLWINAMQRKPVSWDQCPQQQEEVQKRRKTLEDFNPAGMEQTESSHILQRAQPKHFYDSGRLVKGALCDKTVVHGSTLPNLLCSLALYLTETLIKSLQVISNISTFKAHWLTYMQKTNINFKLLGQPILPS